MFMKNIKQKLMEMNSSTPEAVQLLMDIGIEYEYKKGAVISNQQHSYPMLYFVEDGLVRGYLENEGNEHTLWLIQEGFILPSRGFITQISRKEHIEFLNYTRTWSVNLIKASVWASKMPVLDKMLMEIYETILMESFEREFFLRIPNASSRFEYLKQSCPATIYLVSKEIMASYLNISPKHYSRIKSEDARRF